MARISADPGSTVTEDGVSESGGGRLLTPVTICSRMRGDAVVGGFRV